MAKAKEVAPKVSAGAATKHQAMQHGTVKCKCNKCGAEVDVPVNRLYAKIAPAKLAEGEKKLPALKHPDTGEILKPERTIPAKPFVPRRPLCHSDISGGNCDGTFHTMRSGKMATHKSSKQRHGSKD